MIGQIGVIPAALLAGAALGLFLIAFKAWWKS